MKKLGLVGFILIASATIAHAAATAVATVAVDVDSVFELSLGRTDIDFGSMRPGDVKYDIPAAGLRVTTKSNSGNKWFLKINSVSPLQDGANNTIPNENFTWYGWTEGTGKWYGTGDDTLKDLPAIVYESTSAEGVNLPNGTTNVFKFKLALPNTQAAGRYETIVRFTLTE